VVQFTDKSLAVNCPITAWDWNFDDGTAHATTQNPTHTYNWTGPWQGNPKFHTFSVILTVTSAAGSSTKQVNVKVWQVAPP